MKSLINVLRGLDSFVVVRHHWPVVTELRRELMRAILVLHVLMFKLLRCPLVDATSTEAVVDHHLLRHLGHVTKVAPEVARHV